MSTDTSTSMPPSGLLFGREPAALVGGITGVLAVIVGFTGFLTDGQAGAITAALTAVATAIVAARVRPVAPTILTGVIVTGAALVGTFGVSISQEQTGILVGAATALLSLLVVRPQSTPAASPRPDAAI